MIARAGTPVARLVAVESVQDRPRMGFLAGAFSVPEDFDRMGEAGILDEFEGRT